MATAPERSTFAERLGDEFRIHHDLGEPLLATLQEVTELAGDSDAREPFSVLFLAAETPLLVQRIYSVENDGLGRLDLFLVPLGPPRDGEGMIYEAVFS